MPPPSGHTLHPRPLIPSLPARPACRPASLRRRVRPLAAPGALGLLVTLAPKYTICGHKPPTALGNSPRQSDCVHSPSPREGHERAKTARKPEDPKYKCVPVNACRASRSARTHLISPRASSLHKSVIQAHVHWVHRGAQARRVRGWPLVRRRGWEGAHTLRRMPDALDSPPDSSVCPNQSAYARNVCATGRPS